MSKKAEQDDNFKDGDITENQELPKISVQKIKVSLAEINHYQQLSQQQNQLQAAIVETTKSIIESRGHDYSKVIQPVQMNSDGSELTFNLSE